MNDSTTNTYNIGLHQDKQLDDKHLLIVDDNQVFADVLARSLKKRGYHAKVAYNFADAIEIATQLRPQLAVIDLKIELESGLDLLLELQQINPTIKMLILTGYSSIATAVEAIKRGAIDYLCKPADANEILQALKEADHTRSIDIAQEPPSVERLEWEHIQKVLHENDGNISATARSLGMHRRTLQRKLQKRPVKR